MWAYITRGVGRSRSALRPTSFVYHISAAKGKMILCNLTSAKQSRLDREDGKKCNGTSAMLLMTSAKSLLMMPNSTPHYIQSVLLKTGVKY
jgi:hypothetical protein